MVPEAAATADDAVRAASRIGFPVVLKVLSPDVSHKSDVGGVELNLGDEAAVRGAFDRIRANLAAKARRRALRGRRRAADGAQRGRADCGTFRDDRFGAMVMVGLGGVLVEVMKDTALALAPIGGREAAAMLARLRGGQILRGVRGQPGVDIDAIVCARSKPSRESRRRIRISPRWISTRSSRTRTVSRSSMRESC